MEMLFFLGLLISLVFLIKSLLVLISAIPSFSSYSKENVGNINMHNLARARKINIINKYLYNLEDDDLLIHNPKKLREEIKKVQNACNKTDYKANYNYSFLRKKLKLETIRKFNCIKDSQFGFPV